MISGYGTTNNAHNYTFLDEHPIKGASYYRLEQFDYDGISTLSDPIVVNNSGDCGVSTYLNSVQEDLYVLPDNCAANSSRSLQINVYDVNGRLMESVYQNDAEGNIQIDVSGLSSGVYVVSVNNGVSVVNQKVFKK